MIESFLTHEMVCKGEPSLDDYLRRDQIDFSEIISETLGDMIQDLIDHNYEVRKLCKQLSLQSSVTKTAAFEGTITDYDYAQRTWLVINSTAQTGNAVFKLKGSDDDGTTYTTILTKSITKAGKYNYQFFDIYKKYKLDLISIGTTITYSSYLLENIYTRMHRELTRAKIYESLKAEEDDMYGGKYQEYMDRYKSLVNDSRLYYDEDDSGQITLPEQEENSHDVVFRL